MVQGADEGPVWPRAAHAQVLTEEPDQGRRLERRKQGAERATEEMVGIQTRVSRTLIPPFINNCPWELLSGIRFDLHLKVSFLHYSQFA